MCASIEAGHGMSVLRDRLSRATPSGWRDGIVAALDGGRADIVFLDGDADAVWNHTVLEGALIVGEPVSVHAVYGVLAAGELRFSVAAS
jgi:hypothetical protein